MSAEFWAIIGVGVALAAVGMTAVTLGWNLYVRLETRLAGCETRLAAIEKGQARIEGWIAGRFREETVPTS